MYTFRKAGAVFAALFFLPLAAQFIKPGGGVSGPSGGGGTSYTPGAGIAIDGSSIAADTAVLESRAIAQAGASTYCRSTTGNDAYTCSVTPTLSAYTTGGCFTLSADAASSGAATVNINSVGSRSIVAINGGDPVIPLNTPVRICYNGTAFVQLGGAIYSAGATNALVVSGTSIDIDAAKVVTKDGTNDMLGVYDMANASRTRLKSGTTIPGSGSTGDLFFKTDATPGSNLYGWTGSGFTLQGGSSGPVMHAFCYNGGIISGGRTFGPGAWHATGADFDEARVTGMPACTAKFIVPSVETQSLYLGDGADKIFRADGNFGPFILRVSLQSLSSNDTERFGFRNGLTVTNDGCYIRVTPSTSTTPELYCRIGGVDGTPVTMTGSTVSTSPQEWKLWRTGNTLSAQIDTGTIYTLNVASLTNSGGFSPVWTKTNGDGAAYYVFYYAFGMP